MADDKVYAGDKAKRLAHYQKEAESDRAPGLSRRLREYISDPLSEAIGKVMPAGNNRAATFEQADRDARKEVLGYKKGGSVSKASARADGIAQRGKTRGKMI